MICVITGERGESNLQAGGHILLSRDQSRDIETMVLKWEITKGRNPEHRGSLGSRTNDENITAGSLKIG